MKLKQREIAEHRDRIKHEQNDICPICKCDLNEFSHCLDHDHATGAIRAVLCRNCNQLEGKIRRLVNRGRRGQDEALYLNRIMQYWKHHETDRTGLIHYSHKEKPTTARKNK